MKASEIFTPNGDGYDVAPAGVLLLIACELYGEPESQAQEGKVKLKLIVDDFIQAAIAGGYKQADILLTLLARNEQSQRVAQMAIDACSAAGDESLMKVMDKMRQRGMAHYRND
jgi:hypothetical protein